MGIRIAREDRDGVAERGCFVGPRLPVGEGEPDRVDPERGAREERAQDRDPRMHQRSSLSPRTPFRSRRHTAPLLVFSSASAPVMNS